MDAQTGSIDKLQDEDEVRACLATQSTFEGERGNWESTWRDIDTRVDPQGQGNFTKMSPGTELGLDNFDATAIDGLDRYTAAIAGLTIPRNARWHSLATPDKDLTKLAPVQRWLEHANDRLFACRYAPSAGFEMQATADIRQGGKYGTCPLWVDEWIGRGLFYRSLHMSECYVGEDFRGRVDMTHRKFEMSVRQARQMLGEEALTDRMMECWTNENPARREEKFQFLHVLAPREDYEPGNPGPAGKPIKSLYIAMDEKMVLRRRGYASMPMVVSRTSLGAKYGRSPAMKVIGTIKTANEIAKTLLRSAHKATDPALAFFDDGTLSRLSTKPGGLNPGMVDEFGRLLVAAIPGGGDVRFGMEMQAAERSVIQSAFLEELFQILTNPADRMTATQVLEMIQKQGVLVGPFAGQHETEKLGPMIERELDILLRAGQIDPMPPEMIEAGMRPLAIYQNPLARMARAEEAAGFTRWVEVAVQIAGAVGDASIFDHINFDRAMPGLAEVLSVRPSWQNSEEEVAQARAAREQAKQVAELSQALPGAAGAALDLSKANQIAAAA
ncbi:MAG: portal protein [Pseudomonadota bacterium]